MVKVTQIDILAVDNKNTGNAIFDCRIHLEGLQAIPANLFHSHLSSYHNAGIRIIFKLMDGGKWIEVPYTGVNLEPDFDNFHKSNHYGNK